MNKIQKSTETVRAHQVDIKNCLKLSSFFNYAQHAASVHATNLDVGYKNLMQEHLFWVLSWIKFEIISYPKMDETVIIETWPKMKYRLFSLRDFLFYNSDNKVIAKATTAWLMVNAKTKRAVDTGMIIQEAKYSNNLTALMDLPEKISIEDSLKKVSSFKVQYSDIDILQHMNNARYIDHLLDSYSYDFHKTHTAKSIVFSYLREAKADNLIDIYSNIDKGESKHVFEAINEDTKKTVFRAVIDW